MGAKYTYNFVKSFIENKKYTLVSTEYSSCKDYLSVLCPYGHPNEIKHFIRIPYWEPLTEENIRNILTKNGIGLLTSVSQPATL